jgi:hypothetical protein
MVANKAKNNLLDIIADRFVSQLLTLIRECENEFNIFYKSRKIKLNLEYGEIKTKRQLH